MPDDPAPRSDGPTLRSDVFDAFPGQVAVLDEDGTILATNEAWQCFAIENGFTGPAHMIGTNYLAAIEGSPESEEPAAGILEVLTGDSEAYQMEYPCHTPDTERWFMMRALPLDYSDHRYAVVVHTDITARREAEQEVVAHNEQLSAVASILSHDLYNPLTVALGRIELLDGEQADVVERSLERMAQIIDDALAIARMDAVDDVSVVDLATVANAAWDQVTTDEATLRVENTADVTADEELLTHLFENLFRNAVEHGGGGVVTVGTLPDGFYVADDGPGIPAADRKSIFEMGATTSDEGTGIGLSIVKRVADMHGWTVSIGDSEAGGARFDVTGVLESDGTDPANST